MQWEMMVVVDVPLARDCDMYQERDGYRTYDPADLANAKFA